MHKGVEEYFSRSKRQCKGSEAGRGFLGLGAEGQQDEGGKARLGRVLWALVRSLIFILNSVARN